MQEPRPDENCLGSLGWMERDWWRRQRTSRRVECREKRETWENENETGKENENGGGMVLQLLAGA